jgi:hypothetical protein
VTFGSLRFSRVDPASASAQRRGQRRSLVAAGFSDPTIVEANDSVHVFAGEPPRPP